MLKKLLDGFIKTGLNALRSLYSYYHNKPAINDENLFHKNSLEQLTPKKFDDNDYYRLIIKELNSFFRNKQITSFNEYIRVDDKESGFSSGDIISRKDDGTQSILKYTTRTIDKTKFSIIERKDFIHEYITSPLYERLLPGGITPNIELVTFPQEENKIGLRSIYLKNFYTISDSFKKLKILTKDTAKNIINFEKLFAVLLFNGEADYHKRNIGVIVKNNKIYAAKVDHGRSTYNFYKDLNELIHKLNKGFHYYNYPNFGFNLNIEKLIQAVDEINKISESELEILINSRFEKLKKHEVYYGESYRDKIPNNKGIKCDHYPSPEFVYFYGTSSKEHIEKNKRIIEYNNAEKWYLAKYTKQLKIFKELGSYLKFLNSFDIKDKSFNDIGWLALGKSEQELQKNSYNYYLHGNPVSISLRKGPLFWENLAKQGKSFDGIITNPDYKDFIDVLELLSGNYYSNHFNIDTKNYIFKIVRDRLDSYPENSWGADKHNKAQVLHFASIHGNYETVKKLYEFFQDQRGFSQKEKKALLFTFRQDSSKLLSVRKNLFQYETRLQDPVNGDKIWVISDPKKTDDKVSQKIEPERTKEEEKQSSHFDYKSKYVGGIIVGTSVSMLCEISNDYIFEKRKSGAEYIYDYLGLVSENIIKISTTLLQEAAFNKLFAGYNSKYSFTSTNAAINIGGVVLYNFYKGSKSLVSDAFIMVNSILIIHPSIIEENPALGGFSSSVFQGNSCQKLIYNSVDHLSNSYEMVGNNLEDMRKNLAEYSSELLCDYLKIC